MTEQIALKTIIDELVIHPIVKDMLTEDINDGSITTEDELKDKAEEYTNML